MTLSDCRQGSHEIQPADVVLFEGILAFYFAPLRELFDVRLFVDLDADTRLAMRGTTCWCVVLTQQSGWWRFHL